MLPVVLPILAADPEVTGILGTTPVRFYPHGRAPQDVQAPYATWFIVSGIPENTIDEVPRIDRFSVQIDCWSSNSGEGAEEVKALATAIRDALEPFAHMTAIAVDGIDPDTQRNRLGLQFTFWEDREPNS